MQQPNLSKKPLRSRGLAIKGLELSAIIVNMMSTPKKAPGLIPFSYFTSQTWTLNFELGPDTQTLKPIPILIYIECNISRSYGPAIKSNGSFSWGCSLCHPF